MKQEILKNTNPFKLIKNDLGEGKTGYSVEGYACLYNVANRNGEFDLPNCFDNHLKTVVENNQAVPIVIFHNETESQTVGKIATYKSDDKGLFVSCTIVSTPYIDNEVIPKLQAGIYPCFSTCGWIVEGYYDVENDYVVNKEGILSHLALVPQGAALGANATLEEIKNNLKKEQTRKSFFWLK